MAISDEDVPEQPVPECNSLIADHLWQQDLKAAVDLWTKEKNEKHEECIRNILRSSFNVPQDDKYNEMSLLHLVIKFGNYENDEMIVKDPDLKSKGIQVLKLLLESKFIYKEKGAIDEDEKPGIYEEEFGPTRGPKSGFSPLHRAAYQGNGAYVTLLLERYSKLSKRIDNIKRCNRYFYHIRSKKNNADCIFICSGANLFEEHNGKNALYMIMKNCSESEGIFKCLDNCMKNAEKDNKQTNHLQNAKNWEIDFSFLIKYHTLSEKKEAEVKNASRRGSILKTAKTIKTTFSQNSMLSQVEKMGDDFDRSVRESARSFIHHPVTQVYLMKRWAEVKWLFYIGVLLRTIVYATIFTWYATSTFQNLCPISEGENDEKWYSTKSLKLTDGNWFLDVFTSTVPCRTTNKYKHYETQALVSWILLLIFTVITIFGQLWNIANQGLKTFGKLRVRLSLFVVFMGVMSLWHNPYEEHSSFWIFQYHAADSRNSIDFAIGVCSNITS